MVFQNYALYPHLSVYENIAFGLRLRKRRRTRSSERVKWAAQMLELTPYLDRKPKQLSGGQRQRVAMGRAIVREPQAFLMDEPLSNLDAKLRVQMRAEIAKLQHELGDDDDLRHPRPGRGDDDGRPRRRPERRPAPAGGHAAGALRRAGEPVRRRLHRHAADEPARGHASRAERLGRVTSPASRCQLPDEALTRYPGARGARGARSSSGCGARTCIGGGAPRPADDAGPLELLEALGCGHDGLLPRRRPRGDVGGRHATRRTARRPERGTAARPNLVAASRRSARSTDRRDLDRGRRRMIHLFDADSGEPLR